MTGTCPMCGKGKLRWREVEEQMFGVPLGRYRAEVCDKCDEAFFDTEAVDRMEAKAKQLGLWGLAKKVKIARSGNSLVVRIPSDLAKFLKIKGGEEVLVSPEGRERIVVELG